jgi:hypothetical protein
MSKLEDYKTELAAKTAEKIALEARLERWQNAQRFAGRAVQEVIIKLKENKEAIAGLKALVAREGNQEVLTHAVRINGVDYKTATSKDEGITLDGFGSAKGRPKLKYLVPSDLGVAFTSTRLYPEKELAFKQFGFIADGKGGWEKVYIVADNPKEESRETIGETKSGELSSKDKADLERLKTWLADDIAILKPTKFGLAGRAYYIYYNGFSFRVREIVANVEKYIEWQFLSKKGVLDFIDSLYKEDEESRDTEEEKINCTGAIRVRWFGAKADKPFVWTARDICGASRMLVHDSKKNYLLSQAFTGNHFYLDEQKLEQKTPYGVAAYLNLEGFKPGWAE